MVVVVVLMSDINDNSKLICELNEKIKLLKFDNYKLQSSLIQSNEMLNYYMNKYNKLKNGLKNIVLDDEKETDWPLGKEI